MFIPVLIYQASADAFRAVVTQLPLAGFEEGKDFLMLELPEDASEHLDPQREQLFVTGIAYGPVDIKDTVRQLKGEHPRLKAAFFSTTYRLDAAFDLQIDKGNRDDFCKALISEMSKFLKR